MFRFLHFIPNRNFYTTLGLVLALGLIFMSVAHAQEVTDPAPVDISTPTAEPVIEPEPPTAPIIPPDVLPVGDAAAQLFALVLNMLVPFASSPLTATLVSIAKFFIPSNVSAGLIKNVVAALLTVLYWVAVHYNFQATFTSIGQALVTIVPAIFLVYKNFFDSSRIHEDAVKAQTALLGYKRTPYPQRQ